MSINIIYIIPAYSLVQNCISFHTFISLVYAFSTTLFITIVKSTGLINRTAYMSYIKQMSLIFIILKYSEIWFPSFQTSLFQIRK